MILKDFPHYCPFVRGMTGGFPHKGSVMRSFDVLFVVSMDKWSNKQIVGDLRRSFDVTVRHCNYDDVIKWKHFPRYWPFVRGIHRSLVDSPSQRPVTRTFGVFFHVRLNNRLSNQSRCRWSEKSSPSLWHQCNDALQNCKPTSSCTRPNSHGIHFKPLYGSYVAQRGIFWQLKLGHVWIVTSHK